LKVGNPDKDLIQTGEREAELQRRAIEFPGIVACGEIRLDALASILFEARRANVLGQPVVVLSALNAAVDIMGELQEDYRRSNS
jgi:hypothetical protein